MKNLSLYVVLAVLVLFCSCSPKVRETFPPEIAKAFSDAGLPVLGSKVAPRDFSLPMVTSASVPETLARNMNLGGLKGKIVFLNFWATWCGPCKSEMPSMEALYSKYRDRGLEILAVNSGEKAPVVNEFITDYGFSFPVVLDIDGSVSRTYGIQAIPTSYLIDRDGMIILRIVGSIDWNTPQIQAAIELLLDSI